MQITEHTLPEATAFAMYVLDNWELSDEAIYRLLDLPGKVRGRELQRYRQRQKILPYSENLAERLEHIFGIDAALRTSYPKNGTMGAFWLRQPHRRFEQQSPLRIMLDEGLAGLVRVRVEIDCAYGWSLSEEPAKH